MRAFDSANLRILGWAMHGVGALVLMVAGSAYYLTFHRPCAASMIADTKETEKLRRLLDANEKLRRDNAALEKSVAELEGRITPLRARIPNKANESQFLKLLTAAAENHKIKMLDYQRGTISKLNTHSQIEIEIRFEGHYENICSFVDQIHDMPRYVRVIEMQLHSKPAADVYPMDMTIVLPFAATISKRSVESDG